MDSYNATADDEGYTNIAGYMTVEQVLICFSGVVLSIITILGNILVVVAYRSNKRLQTITNLFIFSLSISDITVGVFSINFYTIYVMLRRWPLSPVLCDIWLCLDYGCCQASVIHLIVICLDRYFSLMKPLKYRAKRTRKRAKVAIALAWLVALLLWAPWILSYPYLTGGKRIAEGDCYVQFIYENAYVAIATATAAYYAPVSIMAIVYLRIYWLVKRREKDLTFLCEGKTSSGSYKESRLHRSKYKSAHLMKISLLSKQKKTAKLLSFIFLAFTITWLPYHIFAVWAPFCPTCIPSIGWDLSYILCYLNSTINPFCYALGSKDFCRTFKTLFSKRSAKEELTQRNFTCKKSIHGITPFILGVMHKASEIGVISAN